MRSEAVEVHIPRRGPLLITSVIVATIAMMVAMGKVTVDAQKARALALIDIHAEYANGFVRFASEGYSVHRYWRVEVDKSAHIQEYLTKTQQKFWIAAWL